MTSMINALTRLSRRQIALLAGFGSLFVLLGAFAFQAAGYAPCAMCLWQRWPHAIAFGLGILFALTRFGFIPPLGVLTMGISAGLGLYHTGVERDWWEGPTSCTSAGDGLSGLSGMDLLPSASMDASLVLCDEVVWDLFGLSMASYNALASLALVALWIWAWKSRA
ncbi:disulfide bond formation protein B [Celeribacter marinus]|uniref:disulfide bond formation protein B n=1 Tax=Celeribacter marinus TaxID=1397108 RepID=UPI00317F487F